MLTFDINTVLKSELEKEEAIKSIINADDKTLKHIAENIDLNKLFGMQKKDIKTVALYYHRIYNGGIERVVSLLSAMFDKAGYKIVIITDEDENAMDYPIPRESKRVVLHNEWHIFDKNVLADRSIKLRNIIKEYDIDCVIYNAWMAPQLFYDMCAVKSASSYFIVYTHSHFTASLVLGGMPLVVDTLYYYKQTDAICSLNDADRAFWTRYNKNTYSIWNPFSFNPVNQKISKLDNHNIIWVGRIDDPIKNAFDLLEILSRVLVDIKDATLPICGQGSEDYMMRFAERAEQLNIRDKINMIGFTKNVDMYLSEASVFLNTSDIEGYSMVVAEAFGAGLPVVAYELPYLKLFQESEAVIQVPGRDINEAAAEIVDLFKNKDRQELYSKRAKDYIVNLYKKDLYLVWEKVIKSLDSGNDNSKLSEYEYEAYRKAEEFELKRSRRQIGWLSMVNEELKDASAQLYEAKKRIMILESQLNEEQRKCEQLEKNEQNKKNRIRSFFNKNK